MKSLKFYFLCLITALFLTVFAGCRVKNKPYPFEQGVENISSIEICQYDLKTDSITSIVSLSENDFTTFVNEISEMDYLIPSIDVPQGFGKVIVYITYSNQEAELLGMYCGAKFDAHGELRYKSYGFPLNEWRDLLAKYFEDIDDYF